MPGTSLEGRARMMACPTRRRKPEDLRHVERGDERILTIAHTGLLAISQCETRREVEGGWEKGRKENGRRFLPWPSTFPSIHLYGDA